MTLDDLGRLMDLMHAKGCVQLRDGDVALTMGPRPHAAPTREADPDVVAEESADQQAIREYQEHLYGAHGPHGSQRRQ